MQEMYSAMPNSPSTIIFSPIGSTDTSIPVQDLSVFPAAPNLAVIGEGEDAETILYAGKSADSLTGVTRGFQGIAKAWSTGDLIARNYTAYDHDSTIQNISEIDVTINNHVVDTNIHVTTIDKANWDAKETTSGAQAKANAAETSANSYTDTAISGITPALIGAETPSGAQLKADGAQSASNTYTDAQISSITPAGIGAETPAGAQAKADTAQSAANTYADSLNTAMDGRMDTVEAHVADGTVHVTTTDKASWNAKETPSGAQAKADAAEAAANSYTDQQVGAITSPTADSVSITDTGGNFVATEVEGALTELKGDILGITPASIGAETPSGAQTKANAAEAAAKAYTDAAITSGGSDEEGSFTPELRIGGGTSGVTYTEQEGWYYKLGDLVHIQISLNVSSTGGLNGAVEIHGLPYVSAITSADVYFPTGYIQGVTYPSGYRELAGFVLSNQQFIRLRFSSKDGAADWDNLLATNVSTPFFIMIHGTYLA